MNTASRKLSSHAAALMDPLFAIELVAGFAWTRDTFARIHARRISGVIQEAPRLPATRQLHTALRAKINHMWRAPPRESLERAERWWAFLPAAGLSREALRGHWRRMFDEMEELLLFAQGHLAEVPAKHLPLTTDAEEFHQKTCQVWRAARVRRFRIPLYADVNASPLVREAQGDSSVRKAHWRESSIGGGAANGTHRRTEYTSSCVTRRYAPLPQY